MSNIDRTYTFVAKTLDAPGLSQDEFTSAIRATAWPEWQRLHREGYLSSLQTLRKVGDVDLQTASSPVRDWQYFVLAELANGADPARLTAAEEQVGFEPSRLATSRIEYLSNEILTRPAAAGTAIPIPSPQFAAPPADQLAAIEYIQIPPSHWEAYQRFMKEVMGPVGAHMVRIGHSYQVQILEQASVLHRSESLPLWNRVHILWGRFDDPHEGFFRHTNEAIRAVLGPGLDVQAALDPVNRYRVKPRMSKNRRVEELCL